jgi:flagellar basal-body rod modification protein FlgD
MNGIGNALQNLPQAPAPAVPKGDPYAALNAPGGAEEPKKFQEVWGDIQAKMGAKPTKPREIKKTIGKDDFLRIMITQMKHQDPTKPFDADKLAQELAQITSVEQLQNVNTNLQKMAGQNKPMERMTMTSLIGKTITVDRNRFPHVEGQNTNLSYVLPEDAARVRLQLVAPNGEVAYSKEFGKQKAGMNNFVWDGKKDNTTPAKAGTYVMKVEAENAGGQPIAVSAQLQARVIGVSFEGDEAVFLIGDAKSQQKITMENVIKIEDQGGVMPAFASARGSDSAAIAPASAKSVEPNFFTFKKGEGSKTIQDPGQLDPDVRAALENFKRTQTAQAPAPEAAVPAQPEEKGFPNGLNAQD